MYMSLAASRFRYDISKPPAGSCKRFQGQNRRCWAGYWKDFRISKQFRRNSKKSTIQYHKSKPFKPSAHVQKSINFIL